MYQPVIVIYVMYILLQHGHSFCYCHLLLLQPVHFVIPELHFVIPELHFVIPELE